ncbi:hypothetical protein [Gilliamella sp. Lep-s21]|nr:hypothetical protein [Gilliamella sp. Lep-s21]MWP69867.1 hypothetical protein [Gilliamella sp. Lep-s5]MWP76953.1 hypothetical protein [Gilliamella sp. Lep-s21]
MQYHVKHRTPNTEHRHWQTYVLSLPNTAIRCIFTFFSLISSILSLKLSLKSLAKIVLLALPLLSYSWQLQAANDSNNRAKRSDAIILPLTEVINYARPTLRGGFGGPADIWNSNKGFLVQSIEPQSYNLNFPTTGANGLFFDLLISGVDINKLTWQPVTHEGITATVTNVVNAHLWTPDYEERGPVVARVTLTGPVATINQHKNPNPSPIAKPRLPQTFELVGRDNDGHEVVYGFVLQKWFVNRGAESKPYSDQLAWCNSLGYRMPKVKDLTNAKCGKHYYFPCRNGIDGAKPSSGEYGLQRRIGAGFFTEWGYVQDYYGANFVFLYYWTSDGVEADRIRYNVYAGGGNVAIPSDSPDTHFYAVCTTP